MGWERAETDAAGDEWEREDGHATIRLRERTDGGFVVRLDRLTQAPEGSAYRRETAPDREAAEALAAEWRDAFDVAE
ncbi:DUF7543 family protein [Candidatus Halobonum tyrrellensis]|uniref:Uncharacterized protein n=1 Tax=Candidatus Halobonum tyrrellensis G22 TaxID=1324957 RepID=V4HCT6_9EURY|nr:hypothetical protein [Candidatus Halobonum tyrrellensis]ESP88525.1 hypothetical protein K933_08697 [Candidatus Halobonum tyrrellensis G22]